LRVMVLVKATAASEAGSFDAAWTTEMMADMGRFNDDLAAAGILIMADGLAPSSAGKRIAFGGASRSVSDGPFPNPHELVAGFWLWEVRDIDEAVAWAKRCPNPMPVPSIIEIRPFQT